MIKVGDKFKDELKEWTVCEVYRGAALAFSGNITREFSKQYIYTIMYLEQKQRADELEKRWSELKEWLGEQSSEYMTKYRKTYNERDDEKSETYNEIFNKMMTIEKEDDNA